MKKDKEKLIKYQMYLENIKIKESKKKLHDLKIELEKIKGKGRIRNEFK